MGLSDRLAETSISGLLVHLAEALDLGTGSERPVRTLQIAIARLCCVSSEIKIMIAREIGENQKAYVAMQTLCQQMELSPDSYHARSSPEEIHATRTERQEETNKWHSRVLEGLRFNEDQESVVRAWLLWWLRCGLLGIASRSLREAEHSLYRAVFIAKHGELILSQLQPNVNLSKKDWKGLLEGWNFDYRGVRTSRGPRLTIAAIDRVSTLSRKRPISSFFAPPPNVATRICLPPLSILTENKASYRWLSKRNVISGSLNGSPSEA